ncbi:hypothetical protein FHS98_002961 [Sphingomonas oligoaromativorans]|nr:hypothetical protein [Sphingomonas oligoaromativorans]
MRRQGGAGDTAEELGIGTLPCHGEGPLASVRVLTIHPRPIDRTAIEARWRSGLETCDGKTKIAKLLRQAVRARLADPSSLEALFSTEQAAAEEGAGRENDMSGGKMFAGRQSHTRDPILLQKQSDHLSFQDSEGLERCQSALNRRPEKAAIRLDARAMDGTSLARIEHPIMDRGIVGGWSNEAFEHIDLTNEMALADPPDGRIARHGPDAPTIDCEQQDRAAGARGRSGGLAAGMASAHHDDVKSSGHSHSSCST